MASPNYGDVSELAGIMMAPSPRPKMLAQNTSRHPNFRVRLSLTFLLEVVSCMMSLAGSLLLSRNSIRLSLTKFKICMKVPDIDDWGVSLLVSISGFEGR